MVKTDGRLLTEELAGDMLQVSGRPELLARYVENFRFDADQDGDHRHPENLLASTGDLTPGSGSIIIEVDDELDGARR